MRAVDEARVGRLCWWCVGCQAVCTGVSKVQDLGRRCGRGGGGGGGNGGVGQGGGGVGGGAAGVIAHIRDDAGHGLLQNTSQTFSTGCMQDCARTDASAHCTEERSGIRTDACVRAYTHTRLTEALMEFPPLQA